MIRQHLVSTKVNSKHVRTYITRAQQTDTQIDRQTDCNICSSSPHLAVVLAMRSKNQLDPSTRLASHSMSTSHSQ